MPRLELLSPAPTRETPQSVRCRVLHRLGPTHGTHFKLSARFFFTISMVLGVIWLSTLVMGYRSFMFDLRDEVQEKTIPSPSENKQITKSRATKDISSPEAENKPITKSRATKDISSPEAENKPITKSRATKDISSLEAYFNPSIIQHGCALTVVIMDPKITTSHESYSVWSTLESAAQNLPKNSTCFLLQTSSCKIAYSEKNIKDNAKPGFLSMIQSGNVRVSYINHVKYGLKSCKDFFSPSNAFMNINYWGEDEFTDLDSDLILLMQHDSVLCHYLDPDLWRGLAYVGAVWPPKATKEHNNPFPREGMCNLMPANWKKWSHTSFFNICGTPGVAPLGNGGLSLRSRHWMRKAIETCPSRVSGIKNYRNSSCIVRDAAEDAYFGTVLRGMKNVPMPLAYEAALFSTEMLFPEQVAKYYLKGDDTEEKEAMVKKRWGASKVELYKAMRKEGRVIPLGFHKPWWYHNPKVMMGESVKQYCPLLGDILPSKYKLRYFKS